MDPTTIHGSALPLAGLGAIAFGIAERSAAVAGYGAYLLASLGWRPKVGSAALVLVGVATVLVAVARLGVAAPGGSPAVAVAVGAAGLALEWRRAPARATALPAAVLIVGGLVGALVPGGWWADGAAAVLLGGWAVRQARLRRDPGACAADADHDCHCS